MEESTALVIARSMAGVIWRIVAEMRESSERCSAQSLTTNRSRVDTSSGLLLTTDTFQVSWHKMCDSVQLLIRGALNGFYIWRHSCYPIWSLST